MKASMCAYPWDIADEGIENALDNIQHVAGMNDVTLAISYHVATYFLPHNPRRQLYYGEDGMLLFKPGAKRFKGKIKPRVSEVVDSPDYLKRQTDRIRERGMKLTAWMVYAYSHHLARKYPDCAKRDALGNQYLSQLCVGNPDVRSYFLALTAEMMEKFNPECVILETLSYREFEYGLRNPKINSLTPWHRFLLGLCMCDHCVGHASNMGVDGPAFRSEVADCLRRELADLPSEEEMSSPVEPERIANAFGGRLQQFVAARADLASSLYEEVARTARKDGHVDIQSLMYTEAEVPVTGLSPARTEPFNNRPTVRPVPENIRKQTKLTRWKPYLGLDPSMYRSQAEFTRTMADCIDAGIDGFHIYNYGLLRQEQLKWVGSTLPLREGQ